MTFQFRRWGDLLEDIRYRFSIGGIKSRHPPQRICQLYNVSWQQVRHIAALASDGAYLTPTGVLALPIVPAVTGEAYAEVDWPVDATRVYGVRVQLTASSRWYPLKRFPFAALHDFQYDALLEGYRRQPGPIAWCAREIPKAVEATETPGKIMIVPVPRSGSYRLWYMQAWQPQIEDDDLFPGHEEWHEYAIYSTMIKMLGPDADSKKMYNIWDLERKEARSQIEATAKRLEDGMPLEPRDGRWDGYDPDQWGGPL